MNMADVMAFLAAVFPHVRDVFLGEFHNLPDSSMKDHEGIGRRPRRDVWRRYVT